MKNETHKSMHTKLIHIITPANADRTQALEGVFNRLFGSESMMWKVHNWQQWGDGLGAITSALTSGADLIVAYGDYSLISDVANGIYLHDVPLAIIQEQQISMPQGASMALNTTELEKTLIAFAENRGETLWIDMGDMQDRRFLFHLYMNASQPADEQKTTYQITVDGEAYCETGTACLISRRAVERNVDTGQLNKPIFDVEIMDDVSFSDPSEITRHKSDTSRHFSGSEIRIDASQEQNVFLDGNAMTATSIFVKVIRKAIQVFMPDVTL